MLCICSPPTCGLGISGKGKVNWIDARCHMIQLAEAPAQFKKGFWGVDLGSEDQDAQAIGMDLVGIMEAYCQRPGQV